MSIAPRTCGTGNRQRSVCWPNAGSTLGQRRSRWSSAEPTFGTDWSVKQWWLPVAPVALHSTGKLTSYQNVNRIRGWAVFPLNQWNILLKVKGFIDRSHVNFDILVIFISLFLLYFFMRGEPVIGSVVIIFTRIWTVWVTAYMCAPRKYIGHSGTRTRYPLALYQPRYQWAILAPHEERDQRVDSFSTHYNVLISFTPFEYICYGSTAIINVLLFQCWNRL